ncbi:MAG TPA: 30S ribosomal protein S16 [Nocardioidaceae bacterium]|nr:30S ribosomal protein S16 [Nocardioidaceae bacterium]
MAVKIRLKRMGKIRAPYYRIVVADSRKKRDGRVIEEIGKYHPKEEPSVIEVKSERAQYWLGVGAQPSEAVAAILKITGDWQTFRGEPGTEGTLKVAEPRRAKADLFNEALKESTKESQAEAVTKKSSKKAEMAPAQDAPAATETPGVETPEGATEQAEAVEVKALDTDKAEEKAGGEAPPDKTDTDADTPKG